MYTFKFKHLLVIFVYLLIYVCIYEYIITVIVFSLNYYHSINIIIIIVVVIILSNIVVIIIIITVIIIVYSPQPQLPDCQGDKPFEICRSKQMYCVAFWSCKSVIWLRED